MNTQQEIIDYVTNYLKLKERNNEYLGNYLYDNFEDLKSKYIRLPYTAVSNGEFESGMRFIFNSQLKNNPDLKNKINRLLDIFEDMQGFNVNYVLFNDKPTYKLQMFLRALNMVEEDFIFKIMGNLQKNKVHFSKFMSLLPNIKTKDDLPKYSKFLQEIFSSESYEIYQSLEILPNFNYSFTDIYTGYDLYIRSHRLNCFRSRRVNSIEYFNNTQLRYFYSDISDKLAIYKNEDIIDDLSASRDVKFDLILKDNVCALKYKESYIYAEEKYEIDKGYILYLDTNKIRDELITMDDVKEIINIISSKGLYREIYLNQELMATNPFNLNEEDIVDAVITQQEIEELLSHLNNVDIFKENIETTDYSLSFILRNKTNQIGYALIARRYYDSEVTNYDEVTPYDLSFIKDVNYLNLGYKENKWSGLCCKLDILAYSDNINLTDLEEIINSKIEPGLDYRFD